MLADATGQPRALPIVEILSCREFYDYEAHYDFDVVSLDAPATLTPEVAAEVERVASPRSRRSAAVTSLAST